MTDKKKLHKILSSLWKNNDSVGKTYYNQALQDVQTAVDLQEELVSKDTKESVLYNDMKPWEVPEYIIEAINKKRVCPTFKGEALHKFKNEFNTLKQTLHLLYNLDTSVNYRLALHWASWGAQNLQGCFGISEEEKAKMDIEEPVSEELEEAAWFYADKKCHLDIAVFTSDEVKKEREKMQFTWQDLYDTVMFGAKWQKTKDESTTEDLGEYINELSKQFPEVSFAKLSRIAVRVAKWQKQQDQSTIELAEDHAYFAGSEAMREKILKEIEEAYKKGGVIEAIKRIRELKK